MKEITELDVAKATGFNVTTLRRWRDGESGKQKKKLFEFIWSERRKLVKFVNKK